MAKDLIDHGTGSGLLCLDFANTVEWHASDHPKQTLANYSDLVEWSRRQGLFGSKAAATLVAKANRSGELDSVPMADAVALRESIYRIFSATAHGRSPAKGDLDILNSYLAKAMSKAHIAKEGDHFRWGWNATDPSPDMMLWPIAKSAAEVLTSEKLALVKECANEEEGCGWLFLDSSRSGNRAWCSMKDCGNRAKFRTYYARHSRSAVSRRTKVS